MDRKETYDIVRLFGKQQLNDIQNRLSRITGLGFVTVNYQGEPMTDFTGFCEFCRHFRSHPEFQKNCMASDAMSSIQAAISQKPLIYQCPCGLMEIAIPIIVNGVYLGGFLCGQARCQDVPEDLQRMKPSVGGIALDTALRNTKTDYEAIPVYDYRRYEDIAELVNLVITLLCENKISQLDHERALREQIAQSAFLESSLNVLTNAVRENDYSSLLTSAGDFTRRLYRMTSEAANRQKILISLAKHLDMILIPERDIASVQLYPLQTEWIKSSEYSLSWVVQVLDFHYRSIRQKMYPALTLVFEYINQHLQEELTLAMIVDSCGISQSYVSRLFRTLFDISVTDYIHMRKIQTAKRWMVLEKASAADVSYRLGYREVTYFSRVFKKYEGKTIQEFKQAAKSDNV